MTWPAFMALVVVALLQLPFAYAAYRLSMNRTGKQRRSLRDAVFALSFFGASTLTSVVVYRVTPAIPEQRTWLATFTLEALMALVSGASVILLLFYIDNFVSSRQRWDRASLGVLLVAAWAGLSSTSVTTLLMQPYWIEPQSPHCRRAEPSLLGSPSAAHVGIASRLGYYVLRPARGAVASIRSEISSRIPETWQSAAPSSMHFRRSNRPYVGRVVGMPGETVTIRGGSIEINGERLQESYLFDGLTASALITIHLGDTDYLLAEDIRERYEEQESSYYVAHEKQFFARQLFILWPRSSFGFVNLPRYNVPTRGLAPGLIPPQWLQRLATM